MKAGKLVIKRITKNHVRGHRRSEKVSRNFIKEITLEGNAEVLEREVLAINTASPADAETTCDAIATTAKAINFFIVSISLLRPFDDEWPCKLVSFIFVV